MIHQISSWNNDRVLSRVGTDIFRVSFRAVRLLLCQFLDIVRVRTDVPISSFLNMINFSIKLFISNSSFPSNEHLGAYLDKILKALGIVI